MDLVQPLPCLKFTFHPVSASPPPSLHIPPASPHPCTTIRSAFSHHHYPLYPCRLPYLTYRAWFSRQHRSLYFWLHDAETNTVTGYGFGAEATQAVESGSTLIPTVQTWQLAPSQPILGVATRDPTHAIQTSVKVGSGGAGRLWKCGRGGHQLAHGNWCPTPGDTCHPRL